VGKSKVGAGGSAHALDPPYEEILFIDANLVAEGGVRSHASRLERLRTVMNLSDRRPAGPGNEAKGRGCATDGFGLLDGS